MNVENMKRTKIPWQSEIGELKQDRNTMLENNEIYTKLLEELLLVKSTVSNGTPQMRFINNTLATNKNTYQIDVFNAVVACIEEYCGLSGFEMAVASLPREMKFSLEVYEKVYFLNNHTSCNTPKDRKILIVMSSDRAYFTEELSTVSLLKPEVVFYINSM